MRVEKDIPRTDHNISDGELNVSAVSTTGGVNVKGRQRRGVVSRNEAGNDEGGGDDDDEDND